MPVEIEVRARSEGEPKNAAPSQAEPLLAPRNQP
jgi:hypothetical protein